MSDEKKPAPFPANAEQARLDIELTRQELGETVEALAHKVNVPARAKEQVDQVKAKVKEKVPEPVAEGAVQVADTVRRNPWPIAGGVLALLILIRLIARRSKK